ncbi:hypothetical protein [Sphingobacterium paucimobilis]|uniref:Uncharacterized protein n=1 Tax=Sphingobacterium paucimobilis HER1398 TaxID=1346330 RepID=U2H895_9SPHI|nr:hypothetical protein [Sphingobacterium paucimobilis]ERJ57941.1 hypothetical protein M472_04095 [Sphingobacterium paucimobilis HER1398]
MLTIDQLKSILDAAGLTVDLIQYHLQPGSSLSRQLRLLLNLIVEHSSLDEEECSLMEQLMCRVYPGIDPAVLSKSKAEISAPPEHVSTQWVIAYLDLVKSTFYKQVFKKLLFPVETIGNRQYYLKSEVQALMVRREKGEWTYSKLNKERVEKARKK